MLVVFPVLYNISLFFIPTPWGCHLLPHPYNATSPFPLPTGNHSLFSLSASLPSPSYFVGICSVCGFQGGSLVKNLHARHMNLIPGLGRSPGKGNGNPLQYSCLGNPTDRGRGLMGYSLWGHKRVRHS